MSLPRVFQSSPTKYQFGGGSDFGLGVGIEFRVGVSGRALVLCWSIPVLQLIYAGKVRLIDTQLGAHTIVFQLYIVIHSEDISGALTNPWVHNSPLFLLTCNPFQPLRFHLLRRRIPGRPVPQRSGPRRDENRQYSSC